MKIQRSNSEWGIIWSGYYGSLGYSENERYLDQIIENLECLPEKFLQHIGSFK